MHVGADDHKGSFGPTSARQMTEPVDDMLARLTDPAVDTFGDGELKYYANNANIETQLSNRGKVQNAQHVRDQLKQKCHAAAARVMLKHIKTLLGAGATGALVDPLLQDVVDQWRVRSNRKVARHLALEVRQLAQAELARRNAVALAKLTDPRVFWISLNKLPEYLEAVNVLLREAIAMPDCAELIQVLLRGEAVCAACKGTEWMFSNDDEHLTWPLIKATGVGVAVCVGSASALSLLSHHGASLISLDTIDCRGGWEGSPLLHCILHNHLDCAKMLIDKLLWDQLWVTGRPTGVGTSVKSEVGASDVDMMSVMGLLPQHTRRFNPAEVALFHGCLPVVKLILDKVPAGNERCYLHILRALSGYLGRFTQTRAAWSEAGKWTDFLQTVLSRAVPDREDRWKTLLEKTLLDLVNADTNSQCQFVSPFWTLLPKYSIGKELLRQPPSELNAFLSTVQVFQQNTNQRSAALQQEVLRWKQVCGALKVDHDKDKEFIQRYQNNQKQYLVAVTSAQAKEKNAVKELTALKAAHAKLQAELTQCKATADARVAAEVAKLKELEQRHKARLEAHNTKLQSKFQEFEQRFQETKAAELTSKHSKERNTLITKFAKSQRELQKKLKMAQAQTQAKAAEPPQTPRPQTSNTAVQPPLVKRECPNCNAIGQTEKECSECHTILPPPSAMTKERKHSYRKLYDHIFSEKPTWEEAACRIKDEGPLTRTHDTCKEQSLTEKASLLKTQIEAIWRKQNTNKKRSRGAKMKPKVVTLRNDAGLLRISGLPADSPYVGWMTTYGPSDLPFNEANWYTAECGRCLYWSKQDRWELGIKSMVENEPNEEKFILSNTDRAEQPWDIQGEWQFAKRPRSKVRLLIEKLGTLKTVEEWETILEALFRQDPYPLVDLEVKTIGDDDPRVALRGGLGAFARSLIPAKTVIGAYRGLMMAENEVQEVNPGSLLAVESYAMEMFVNEMPAWKPLLAKHKIKDMLLSAHFEGNDTKFINDCLVDAFDDDNYHVVAPQNVRFCHVNYKYWPYIFVVSTKDIAAGEELLLSYGRSYWSGMRLLVDRQKGVDSVKRFLDPESGYFHWAPILLE